MFEFVLAIPTFRRPAQLSRLLDTVQGQARHAGALVLVGDNDCDEAVRRLVEARSAQMAAVYLPVPDRGVAQVRNALVSEALRLAPQWRWLLMLDDDGEASSDWMKAIVACGDRFEADLVGGPVEGVLPPGTGLLASQSVFARRRRWSTGYVDMLNTTQNLAISRGLLSRLSPPLFDPRLGGSGGEDYDLFRRTARAGGRLVWCDEAMVLEPAPAERLTRRALLHRYYSTGIYMAPIDAAYDGMRQGALVATKGLAGAILSMLGGALAGRPEQSAQSVLMVAHYLGRIAGLLGAKSARYLGQENS